MMHFLQGFIHHRPRTGLVVIIIVSLIGVALIGALRIGFVRSFGIVFESVLLLFLPGFFVTLIFFPEGDDILLCNKTETAHGQYALDAIERITLAILLSIVISSVVVFGLYNIFQVSRLTPYNLVLAIIFVNMIGGIVAVVTKLARKGHN